MQFLGIVFAFFVILSWILHVMMFFKPSFIYFLELFLSFDPAYFEIFLVGVFAKLQKVTFSFVMSVHLFFSLSLTNPLTHSLTAGNSMDPTGWTSI
jgi:hypothetical protein